MMAKNYIAERLKQETDVVFGITGSAIMNLFDSLDKKGFKIINNHHEQASAMAADGYARVSGKIGLCVVTSGPGATNAITGTCCSWYDGIPVLTIAGQVPTSKLKTSRPEFNNLRQRGFQETDTLSLFKTITKMSKCVQDVERDLEEAIKIAKEDRKGPVFLDLCDDIQRKEIEGRKVTLFSNPVEKDLKIREIIQLIKESKRPIIIAGAGVKSDKKTRTEVAKLVDKLGIPTLLTWGAMELLPYNHPLNCRDFGTTSQRVGNFIVKNADLVICLGARLNTNSVMNDLNEITDTKIIMVDVDEVELKKQKIHLGIHSDLYSFAKELERVWDSEKGWEKWLNRIQYLRKKYPLPKTIPYQFISSLSEHSKEGDIIIADTGQTLTWTFQAWKVKKDQLLFSALNHTPMGYALPASIGAQIASPESRVICLNGDGGFQMNIQELQTIIGHNLPIKIFVFNNQGYGAIKQNQDDWSKFLNYRVACEPYMTDLKKIARGFDDIKYFKISDEEDFYKIKEILDYKGPVICEVEVPDGTKTHPKIKAGDGYDDLTPKLDEEERKKINDFLKNE
jgi:acetolactate synthase-1/2/3 large subunit